MSGKDGEYKEVVRKGGKARCREPIACPKKGCDGKCPAFRAAEGGAVCKSCSANFPVRKARQMVVAFSKEKSTDKGDGASKGWAKGKNCKDARIQALEAEVKALKEKTPSEPEVLPTGAGPDGVPDPSPDDVVKAAFADKAKLEAVPAESRSLFNYDEQLAAVKAKIAEAQARQRASKPLPDRQAKAQEFLKRMQAGQAKAAEATKAISAELEEIQAHLAEAKAEEQTWAEKVASAQNEVTEILALAVQATGATPAPEAQQHLPVISGSQVVLIENLFKLVPELEVQKAAEESGTTAKAVADAVTVCMGNLRAHAQALQSPAIPAVPQSTATSAAAQAPEVAPTTSHKGMDVEAADLEMLDAVLLELPEDALDEAAKGLFKEQFLAKRQKKSHH